MWKTATCCKHMLLIVFIMISFGISLKAITSYIYFATTDDYFNDLVRGVRYSGDPCQEARDCFWNATIRENISFSSCIKRNDTDDGIFSYFVNENFVGTTCPRKVIRLAEKDMPQVALASFPGSGNTWSRHLIEYVSGIATGSIYCGLLVRETFIGECNKDTSKTIVIKTHLPFKNKNPIVSKYEKAILILRNPFDALVADFNRRNANLTTVAPKDLFQSKTWEQFVAERVREWRKHGIYWITEYKGPLHIVFYDNMVSIVYEEMYKLFTFLGISVTHKEMWCASINQEGRFHLVEKPEWLKTSALFTSKMKTFNRQNIKQVSVAFKSSFHTENPLLENYYTT